MSKSEYVQQFLNTSTKMQEKLRKTNKNRFRRTSDKQLHDPQEVEEIKEKLSIQKITSTAEKEDINKYKDDFHKEIIKDEVCDSSNSSFFKEKGNKKDRDSGINYLTKDVPETVSLLGKDFLNKLSVTMDELPQNEKIIYSKLQSIMDKDTHVTKPFKLIQLASALKLGKDKVRNCLFNLQKKGVISHLKLADCDSHSATGIYAKTKYLIFDLAEEEIFSDS